MLVYGDKTGQVDNLVFAELDEFVTVKMTDGDEEVDLAVSHDLVQVHLKRVDQTSSQ